MDLVLEPVGWVVSSFSDRKAVPLVGAAEAHVEVLAPYVDGLHRLESYSHLWILCWFHRATRTTLRNAPKRADASLPEYGVFALRSPSRPNPISLTLVELVCVDDDVVRVRGLDAVHGTPVLDIKPYDHHDSVFSPDTPRFPSSDPQHRRERLHAQALRHHQEACRWLDVGLDLAIQAEGIFGHLCDPALTVEIEGPPCLADVIQGLTAARFANPPRLRFTPNETVARVVWRKHRASLQTSTPVGHEASR